MFIAGLQEVSLKSGEITIYSFWFPLIKYSTSFIWQNFKYNPKSEFPNIKYNLINLSDFLHSKVYIII